MKIVTTVRDAVYEAIYAARRELIITDFELTKTYYPDVKLQGITKPRVYVVGSQWTEEKLSRNNTKSVTLPVQVAVIQKVIPTDTDAIDTLIAFVEELNACVANVSRAWFYMDQDGWTERPQWYAAELRLLARRPSVSGSIYRTFFGDCVPKG
jgi:hypothetical protein